MTDEISTFIEGAQFGETPFAPAESLPQLTGAATEGAVVASNLIAYDERVPLDARNHVANWMLFASLVATSAVPEKEETEKWMDAYLSALTKTGWVATSGAQSWHEERATGATVHQEILKLLPVLLGPAATALALVTAALTSLDAMDKGSPWITLFDRRGKDAKAVGFQIVACAPAAAGAVALDGGDFRIHVARTMTQVLFFKFTNSSANLYRRQARLELSEQAMAKYGPAIQAKVDAWVLGEIAAFPVPTPPAP